MIECKTDVRRTLSIHAERSGILNRAPSAQRNERFRVDRA